MNKLFKLIGKFIFAILIIYSYNVFALPLKLSIPFNIVTIIFVCIFDFTGLLGLILFKALIF